LYRILLAILSYCIFLNANTYENKFVLGNPSLILEKTKIKVNLIGDELSKKLNYKLYISITDKSLDKKIKNHIKLESQQIKNFYKENSILISIALDIKKVELISSIDISTLIDKNDILNNYIIPFLVSYDKNTQISKYSAGILNGYSEIAESIANKNDIILDNAIYNGSKDVFDSFRIAIYGIFFFVIFFFLYKKLKRYQKK
jgi:hypothetical protein